MDAIVVGFVLKVLLPPLQEDILLTTLLVKKLLSIHEVQIPTQKGVNQIFISSTGQVICYFVKLLVVLLRLWALL